MQALLEHLQRNCAAKPWQEKILLVKDFREGDRIREALAGQSGSFAHLRTFTPQSLAQYLTEDIMVRQGWRYRDGHSLLPFLEEVLAQLSARRQLDYFARQPGEASLGPLLLGAVLELRRAGLEARDLKEEAFVTAARGREMRAVLAGFDRGLHEAGILDGAALMRLALEHMPTFVLKHRRTLFLIPEHLEMDALVYRFLERLTRGCRAVLPAEPVWGLEYEGGHYLRPSAPASAVSPLSWLYAVEQAPALEHNLELFSAYGASNEAREILRRVQRQGIRWDQVLVAYTRRELYVPLFFVLAAEYALPLTFGQGVPVYMTAPGRLALGILRWLQENEDSRLLARLWREGCVSSTFPEEEGRWLRCCPRWGREETVAALEEMKEAGIDNPHELAVETAGLNIESGAEAEARPQLIGRLRRWFHYLPRGEGELAAGYSRLCRGLDLVLEDAPVHTRWDQRARERLSEELELLAAAYPEPVTLTEAARALQSNLQDLWAGAQGPRPGHLHVAPFHACEFETRAHTFVVGLHEGCFPGRGLQDPLLLDAERRALGSGLLEKAVSPENNLYRMVRFLATRPGPTTLSFPRFDLAENRPSYPSSLFLQAFRLQTRSPRADYSQLWRILPPAASFTTGQADQALDEGEWWLTATLDEQSVQAEEDVVARTYPALGQGLVARRHRARPAFTAYDGLVHADTRNLDPRQGGWRVAPSRLEALATCPFAYFLRFVLGVQPPPGAEMSADRWLDPPTRGRFLHQVYARFVETSRQESLPREERRELLERIAVSTLDQYRRETPVPNPRVYQYEVRMLQRDLQVFWRLEEQLREEGSQPLAVEASFGLASPRVSGDTRAAVGPVRLRLPSGARVSLCGRIDRLDFCARENRYQVWDYKTGRARDFQGRVYLAGGRQLQHAIYALGARELLAQHPLEETPLPPGGYLFPTEEGEGERVLREQHPDLVSQVLECLCQLLAQGTFFPFPHGQFPCTRYCPYARACQAHLQGEKWWQRKAEGHEDGRLQPWEELQKYE